MRGKGKLVVGAIVTVAGVYFVGLPLLWPVPEVSATIPAEVSLRQDPKFDTVVRAWHRNVNIISVRFYVGYYGSTAKGPKGLFYPCILYEGPHRELGRSFGTSFLTFPWSERHTLKLPLRDFAAQGLAGPGPLVGKLDFALAYVAPHLSGRQYGGNTVIRRTQSISFHITVRK